MSLLQWERSKSTSPNADEVLTCCRSLMVAYGVESWSLGFFWPMEMYRKLIRVKDKTGGIDLGPQNKRKPGLPERTSHTGGKTDSCWSQSQGRQWFGKEPDKEGAQQILAVWRQRGPGRRRWLRKGFDFPICDWHFFMLGYFWRCFWLGYPAFTF